MKNFTVLHFIYIVSHQTEKEENTVKVFFLPAKKIEIPVLLQKAHENSYGLGIIQYNIILYGQTRLFCPTVQDCSICTFSLIYFYTLRKPVL
jgi:hypothetical protein